MKRPLLPVALSYAGGVLLGHWLTPPLAVLFAVTAGLLVAAGVSDRWRPRLLVPLWALAGWVHLLCVTLPLSPRDLRHAFDGRPVLARVRGVLAAEPARRRRRSKSGPAWRTSVVLRVSGVATNDCWRPVRGRVVARIPDRLPAGLHAGAAVEVYGILRRPAGPAVEGLFDWGAFLRQRRIWFELVTEDRRDWRLPETGAPPPGWPARFGAWARRALGRGLPPEDENVELLRAMTLGWRTALTDEVAEPFMRTGTMHLFAISGLHIGLVAAILVALLRVLQVPRGACAGVVLPLLWFYVAVTGWQASAVRASLMMSVVVGGWSLHRPLDLLNSLCAAAWIILLRDPLQLFQASFQLSFFVVLNLALWMPVFEQAGNRLLRIDPLLPPELVPRRRRALNTVLRWTLLSVAVSFSAWLGSLPLIAYYFHLITPVNLLANVLMVPAAAGAVMSCMGSLLTGAWAPALAVGYNHSAWLLMKGMVGFAGWAATWPGAFRYVRAPAPWQMALYYGVLIAVVGGRCWRRGRRRGLVAGAGLLALGFLLPPWFHRHATTLTVLPLDGGGAWWVDRPGRAEDLLVDCGDEYRMRRLTLPFLRSRGVNVLPTLLLTHGDIRHTGGAAALLAELPVRRVVVGPHPFRSPSYRALVRALEDPAARGEFPGGGPVLRRVRRGDLVAGWRVLYPGADDRFPRADDHPLILRREFAGGRVLLLPDLGEAGQAALLRHGETLAADVLLAGLPVGEKPLRPPLLARVHPRVAVFSDADWPPAQCAPPGLLARVRARGGLALTTGRDGALILTLRPGAIFVRAQNRPAWRWEGRAGTSP